MANGNTSFGYLLPTREVVMAAGDPDFASMIDLAETAEGLGFDSSGAETVSWPVLDWKPSALWLPLPGAPSG